MNPPPTITDRTRIVDLDVSVRLSNILLGQDCATIGDIRKADWDRLKFAKNMGRTSWREFIAFTVTYGLARPKASPEKVANQELLDHFAGLAMQALVQSTEAKYWSDPEKHAACRASEDIDNVVGDAYRIAEAMIEERTNRISPPRDRP